MIQVIHKVEVYDILKEWRSNAMNMPTQSFQQPQPSQAEQQVVYQADGSLVQALRETRDHIHHVCHSYMNRPVRIQTIDGFTCDGVIVNVDRGIVYVQTQQPVMQRGLYNAYMYNNVILPLVLYELLVITLMVT
ncbi:acetyl-CoA acetyltransferase [Paenibacillus alvei]|uniref:acetyl-CoA acetyltransferase n=1 Tax=Paenibacillus alvei TaxID=44250 RepID=UPI001F515505|nr:acetyl-CoA acetyltransferase [Paenibacillus alvei]MCY9580701.1 acetyl-CoA acetyltransferase [Paenibacillus alvei]